MLNLIYGVSGSGKTALLTEKIREDIQNHKSCFLLVPEQQAYISESEVPHLYPSDARLYFEVVHFSGLADKVFHQYGGVTQQNLQGGIRTLLMWDTLRTLAPMMKEYRSNAAKDISLTSLMLQTVNELRMKGVNADQLEKVAEELPCDHPLKNKLLDLAMIDSHYAMKLEGCMASDLPDRLLRMAEKLEQNNFFSGCHVYIDSFTSFTMQEYHVLRQIIRQADNVTVALCTDGISTKLPHFATPTETAIRLSHIASDLSVPVKTHRLSPKSTAKSRILNCLERDLWRFEVHKKDRETFTEKEQSTVKLLSCSNLYEESEAAALHILDLVQGGMHYGEIAVIVRDTEVYRGVLDAAFERYGIPFFLSERTDLSSKPLARLILSALRAVGHNYSQQDIMTLVKTGLCGVDFADASMFEEYCETWHISNSRFLDSVWSMNADGLTTERSERGDAILAAANRTRQTVMEPLQRFGTAMRRSCKLVDRCRALYQYLCDLSVSEQLSERAKRELLANDKRAAGETLRLYRFVIDSMTTLCSFLPECELSIDEFLLALTILFSESDLGSIPSAQDCVVIGSANTLRVENIKAGLLLGLCEGEFPASVADNGILSERDKTLLAEKFGIALDSRESVRSSEELLYVYRAITKPTERLILSTVGAQPDGTVRTPSLAFTRIAFLLGREKVDEFDMDKVKASLGKLRPELSDQHWLLPKNKEPITLRLSHTKLQTFLQCPYKYYSLYRLQLREAKDSRPSYADDGLFLHYVFEHFLRESLDENGTLKIPEDVQIEPLADRIIEKYLGEICPSAPEHTDRHLLHLFARLRSLALLILRDILAELKESRFVPYRFEQVIGGRLDENGIPAPVWNLSDGSKVVLSGKIDRVDLYQENETLYLRVVDYKSGKHEFKLSDVASGLDVQLVLYLFALLSSQTNHAIPAGSQFLFAQKEDGKLCIQRSGFLLDDDAVKTAWEDEKGRFTKALKAQTLDEMTDLERQMKEAVSSAAERILAGEAQKTPSEDACRFCPVRTACDKAYHE